MTDLEDIRSFVEVVETGGFARAAKRLNVSKSIVSRRIGRLEADLGVRLLSRTTRGISPTEAGLEFKLRGERILADLAAATEAVAQHGSEVMGHLRISLPMGFGIRHVAPVLAEVAARHPRLEIEASYSDRFVDLIAERFDLAIRIGSLKDSTLVGRRIAPIGVAIVASPAYLARHGRPDRPEDLIAHECLLYTGSADRELWRFRAGKRWIDVRPQGRMRSDNGDAIMRYAMAGLGIAALPTFIVTDAVRDGSLVPLLTDYEMPGGAIYAVRPPGAQVPARVRVVIDALVERFGGEPDWDPCQMAARRRAYEAEMEARRLEAAE
ncbi:LysR family transcriptional regulator [Microvirga pudoricolor]|uniref:LysR family transcriptional regulator n=1 Tax=Microvirga pudoricolor TaxID=2778729 RepID=UPI00194E9457|nr:LysR family transcriptional regulator [Microvirga pudoricolor]MBM6596141.1 LysR family transcriptional regulator [Microvirga pudoricolor]